MVKHDPAPRFGWIGTGRMGSAMAVRLAAAGNDVAVWNRTRAKAEPLAEHGATVVDRLEDLADRDVVFVVVSASNDLEQVTLGPGGVLARAGVAPRIIVDHSTVSVESSERVRAGARDRGCAMLAAPVSGNADVIAAGLGSLVVSGPRDAFDELEPHLLEIVQAAVHVGEEEESRLVKIAHNAFLCGLFATLVEVTALAEKGGVSRTAFLEFINRSPLGSRFTRYKTPALTNLDYTPTFTMSLLRKDLELALDEGRRLDVPLTQVSLVHQAVQAALGQGYTDVDFAALLEVQAKNSGLELRSEDAAFADGVLAGN
jgi:3-hydroxyisobutyrate dehydrogenase-like beta-hydroxyacid dehydrogenase